MPIEGPCVICDRIVPHNGKQFICPRRHLHPEKNSPSAASPPSPPKKPRRRPA